MSKVIYVSTASKFTWRNINPIAIYFDLLKYHELIVSMTILNFRAAYQASYLGIAWQLISPLMMLSLFYFVFGVILGGRFAQTAIESPLDFALALFIGLSFFNLVAQHISSAPSLIISNKAFVKNISFPLEVIPITSVLTTLLTLVINLLLTFFILLITKHHVHPSGIFAIFYVVCIFLITLGISWGMSALGVFVRDISAMVSPLTILLMFMCPIFYPSSMVPHKIRWIIVLNPIAVIIEDVRSCLLYGLWPKFSAVIYVFLVSLLLAIIGYIGFTRSKQLFADVI